MSVTAAAWLGLLAVMALLSLRRPVWAVALYFQTFFAAPHLWWWGDEIPRARYSLWVGALLLARVLTSAKQTGHEESRRLINFVAIAMMVNATIVNYVISSHPDVSLDNYTELMKYTLLFFMMRAAIRDKNDFRIALVALALGATYIGYEVTINHRGDFNGSRLEGVGAPGADNSNSLANVMLMSLPMIISLVLQPSWIAKITAVLGFPLVLNVVILCNSRGAFLGLIATAATFLLISRGKSRKRALVTLVAGGFVLFSLLGDADIMNRFATTFAGAEERDNSAASRLEFWQAGLLMLKDYPLGDGGGSFKFVHGARYISAVTGSDADDRSLHNGYLTEATEWGVQGFALKMALIILALSAAYRTTERARKDNRLNDSLLGLSVIVSCSGFLICTMFGSTLSNEWAYWLVAILARYAELYAPLPSTEAIATTVTVVDEPKSLEPIGVTAGAHSS